MDEKFWNIESLSVEGPVHVTISHVCDGETTNDGWTTYAALAALIRVLLEVPSIVALEQEDSGLPT